MTTVNLSERFPVPAETVWSVIGSFGGMPDWHPAVQKSETKSDGGVTERTLTLVGGGTIVERLEKNQPNERTYTYSVVSGPLPVADYTATLKVKADDTSQGCIVEWSSEFQPKGVSENDAATAIQGVYEAGFENLRRMFASK